MLRSLVRRRRIAWALVAVAAACAPAASETSSPRRSAPDDTEAAPSPAPPSGSPAPAPSSSTKDAGTSPTTPADGGTKTSGLPPLTTVQRPFTEAYGCRPPYEAPWLCENVTLDGAAQGSFLTATRPNARYLVAAPHGWFDAGTDAIVASLFPAEIPAGLPVWSQLVAHSFRGNAPAGLAHNVNRPSLLDNDTCQDQPELATSKKVYALYKGHMQRLAPNAALYFEIHGQSEPGLEASLEVATARVSRDQAETIRKTMTDELARAGIEGVRVVIEPVDTVYFNAGLTKECGSLGEVAPAPAIHTEIPKVMRETPEAQLKSARFYRALLMRLATEVFPAPGSAPSR